MGKQVDKQHKKLKGWYTAEFMIKNSTVSSYGPSPSWESETSSELVSLSDEGL